MWFIYSILCAVLFAFTDVISKKILSVEADVLKVACFKHILAIPIIGILFFYIQIPKEINSHFWKLIVLWLPLEITAILIYMKALKVSPLSLTVPFLSLTPIFLIFTSFILLNEKITLIGIFGIILIVIGAYVLNIKDISKGFFDPFKLILSEKGSVLMIIVAIIYSITANLMKMTINLSSILFVAFFYVIVTSLVLLIILSIKYLNNKSNIKIKTQNKMHKDYILLGTIFGLAILTNSIALKMVEVPYMISIKRTSILFSIFFGYIFFKEKNIKQRFLGAIFIMLGIITILFSKI